jgi:hypothetical protein
MIIIILLQVIETNFYSWPGWIFISAVAASLASIAACLYTYFTYHLLRSNNLTVQVNNRLAEFQIYNEISKTLYQDIVQELVDKCADDTLKMSDKVESLKVRRTLLDPLEDLSKFWMDNLLTSESINTGFGFLILHVGNNSAIVEYIKDLRNRMRSPNLYNGFEELYNNMYEQCDEDEKRSFRSKFI